MLSCPGVNHSIGYDEGVTLKIELDREDDGRWIAEARELPGVMCDGETRDMAIRNAERRLATRNRCDCGPHRPPGVALFRSERLLCCSRRAIASQ